MRKPTRYALAAAVPIMLLATACASTSQSVTAPEKNAAAPADQLSSTGEWIPDDASLNLQPAINAYLTKIVGPTFPTGQGTPGLGGVSIDLQNRTINIAWKGLPNPATQSLIGNPPAGVRVALTQAPFSLTELSAGAARLASVNIVAATGYEWSGIAPDSSATHLNVWVYGGPQLSSPSPSEQTTAKFAGLAGVPVNLLQGSKPISTEFRPEPGAPRPATPSGPRWRASAPYGGGAAIESSSGGTCTTSFVGTTFDEPSVVTANHCGIGDTDQWKNGTGAYYGTGIKRSFNRDTQLLQLASSRLGSFVYDGTYQGEKVRPIAGAAFTFEGDYVCAGGAISGQHCNVKVDNVNVTIPKYKDYPYTSYPGAFAHNIDGQIFAMQGDSGGPVWMFADDSHNSVLALGVVSGLSRSLPAAICTKSAAPGYEKGVCGDEGWFALFSQAMSDYQLQIKTQ